MWANNALGHISCSVRHLLFSLAICTTWSLSCEGPICVPICHVVVHLRGSLEQRVAENTGNYGRNILPGLREAISELRELCKTWDNMEQYLCICCYGRLFGRGEVRKAKFVTILPCANFRKTVCCENLIGLLSKINRHLKLLSFLLSGFHVGIHFFTPVRGLWDVKVCIKFDRIGPFLL